MPISKRAYVPRVAVLVALMAVMLWASLAKTPLRTTRNGDHRRVNEINRWIRQLSDGDYDSQSEAARKLAEIKDVTAVEPLIAALKDQNPRLRCDAAYALGNYTDSRVVNPLITALNDEEESVARAAATSLGQIGAIRAVTPLSDCLRRYAFSDSGTPFYVVKSLGEIATKTKDPKAVAPLLALLAREDLRGAELKITALEILSKIEGDIFGSLAPHTERVMSGLIATESSDPRLYLSVLEFLDAHPIPKRDVGAMLSGFIASNSDPITLLEVLRFLGAHPNVHSRLTPNARTIVRKMNRRELIAKIAPKVSRSNDGRWIFDIDLYNTTARTITLNTLAATIDKGDRIFYNKEGTYINVQLDPFSHRSYTGYWVRGDELRGGVCTLTLRDNLGSEVSAKTRLVN